MRLRASSTYSIGLLVGCLTASVQASDWTALFDARTLSGWANTDGTPITGQAWQVDDGMIHLDVARGHGGHIVSQREYGDFELVFEWKIAPRANSGIKYRVKDFDGRVLGCEYQIIDDKDYGDLRPEQTTAALYDLYAPQPHQLLRPPGEFNRGAIVVQGNRIEHWLNGHLVMEAVVGSDEWKRRVAASKFSDAEGFGENHCGRIMLTDHGDEVWYRNVFIRGLAPVAAPHAVSIINEPACRAGCRVGRRLASPWKCSN